MTKWLFSIDEEKVNQLYDMYKNDFPEILNPPSAYERSFKMAQEKYENELKRGY